MPTRAEGNMGGDIRKDLGRPRGEDELPTPSALHLPLGLWVVIENGNHDLEAPSKCHENDEAMAGAARRGGPSIKGRAFPL